MRIDKVNTYEMKLDGGTGTQGTMSWNTDEETADLIQNGATLQIGQEIQWHCRNNTVSSIPDGTPVMATGTIGASGRITIAPMVSTVKANSKFFLGLTTETIAAGDDGKVTDFGKVRGVNTTGALSFGGLETWSDGDVLYLDPSNDGYLTNVEPPNTSDMSIPCAFVVNAASNGTLAVRVNSTDEHGISSEVDYDNTTSGLTATNVKDAIDEVAAGSGGATDFDGLSDTPANKTGSAGKAPLVNSGETALEYKDVVQSDTTGITGAGVVKNKVFITQANFDLIGTPDPNTEYIITDAAAVATALKSATTDVDTSAATAPTVGQVLTATSSTTATWQTPAGGGWEELANVTLGAAAATISSGTFTAKKNMQIRVYTPGLSAGGTVNMRFNGDTSAVYDTLGEGGASSTYAGVNATSFRIQWFGISTSQYTCTLELTNLSGQEKIFSGTQYLDGQNVTGTVSGVWANTSQVTSITILDATSSANLLAGSQIIVYGRD